MSCLASEKRKILQFTFLTFHFVLIKTYFKYLERGKKKKDIMQICSQSYSQVDYWDLTKTFKYITSTK